MSHFAIKADKISKEFIIHHESDKVRNKTLTEALRAKYQQVYASIKGTDPLSPSHKESFWALKDISFEVAQGSRLGIIGRNGAGKSTLLKILSRIMEPTSGQAKIRGRLISLLEVGVGFHPDLTGRENIFLNGALLGMKKSEVRKKFDTIVDFSEIENFLDTPVKRYSSGMYMKLAFSVAAHQEPEILIVDEALAVGDAQFQKKCIDKMEEISKSDGRTVIFVSHNIEAIRTLCTDGLFMEHGRLIAQGDIKTVIESYVSSFLGENIKFTPNRHKPVFFNSIELNATDVQFGDDIRVSCEVISSNFAKYYTIGLGIFNSMDVRVASVLLWSERPLEKGRNSFTIKIPIKTIVPGQYNLAMAIAIEGTTDIQDVVMNYPSFEVLPDSKNSDLFSLWHDSWGSAVLDGSTLI